MTEVNDNSFGLFERQNKLKRMVSLKYKSIKCKDHSEKLHCT